MKPHSGQGESGVRPVWSSVHLERWPLRSRRRARRSKRQAEAAIKPAITTIGHIGTRTVQVPDGSREHLGLQLSSNPRKRVGRTSGANFAVPGLLNRLTSTQPCSTLHKQFIAEIPPYTQQNPLQVISATSSTVANKPPHLMALRIRERGWRERIARVHCEDWFD